MMTKSGHSTLAPLSNAGRKAAATTKLAALSLHRELPHLRGTPRPGNDGQFCISDFKLSPIEDPPCARPC